jgi:hypothetical protein
MVRLYQQGSASPITLTAPTYAADGRLEIPVQVGSIRYTRIDLLLPQSLFTQALQGPVTDLAWKGFNGTYPETTPDDGDALALKRRSVRH